MHLLFKLFIPNSILIVGALYFVNSPYLKAVTRFQIDFGSIILVILCALLAWRFDRSRVIYVLQLLLYTEIGIHYLKVSTSSTTGTIFTAVVLINLMLLAAIRERGIHSLRGLFVIGLPAIQATSLFYWLRANPEPVVPYFDTSYLQLPPQLSGVPEVVLLLLLVTFLLQGIRFLRYPNPLESAIFWAIGAVAATLFLGEDIQSTVLRATSVMALLISFIESAYTLAYRDELTGVPGRRALMETFSKLGSRYTIAMVDIDFFKKFNDKYGHDIGDQVLQMVATRLSKCTGGGKAYRYGGEEFCVVFPGKYAESCLEHLEALRVSIGDEPFVIRKVTRPLIKPKKTRENRFTRNSSVTVTISIGVAEKTSQCNQPEAVMKQADLALYRAKEAGRNKVCT